MARGNLKQKIAPEKNSGHVSGLSGIHVQVAAHGGQSHGDVRPVDERDRIHEERDGDDVQPTLAGYHAISRGKYEFFCSFYRGRPECYFGNAPVTNALLKMRVGHGHSDLKR